MKKITKNKKNWFKIQFKKHPYIYSVLIGWIIIISLVFIFDHIATFFDEFFLIIFVLLPPIIFFLWLRKNKSKIKPFFKRSKKIFKPILYFLGSIASLIVIFVIVGIIATRGVGNFIERVKFETIVLKLNYGEHSYYMAPQKNPNYDYDYCSIEKKGFANISVLGEDFADFEFRLLTQFLDYYEHDILKYKSNDNQAFNHCLATRILLKEAHHNKQIAKEILAAYSPYLKEFYEDPLNEEVSILSKYTKILNENNLNNPALMYSYANHYFREGFANYKPKGLEYIKQSAEDGYLSSIFDLIVFRYDYDEKNFKVPDCKTFLKYNNILVEEKAFIPYIITFWTYMGKRSESGLGKRIYQCTNDKHDFAKAYSLVNEIHQPRFQYWKALFILNGWGDIKQDYNKAYELFSKTQGIEGVYHSLAYLSYMNFKGLGVPKNPKKGLDFAIKLIERKYVSEDEPFSIDEAAVLCEKNQYKKEIISCLKNSTAEANLKLIKDHIKVYMENFFKNPNLLKTLNYLGEAK